MHGATRTNLHCWSPHPAQRLHDSSDGSLVDACPRVAYAAFPRACSLAGGRTVHQVIDLLIGKTCRNGNRSHNAITSLTSVSSSRASAIVESKVSSPSPKGHSENPSAAISLHWFLD